MAESPFKPDLQKLSAEPDNKPPYSEQEIKEITEKFEVARKKNLSGEELTIEDQKNIVLYNRAIRETKFVLAKAASKTKTPKAPKEPKEPKIKERKPKKLSAKKLMELVNKFNSPEGLTPEEKIDVEFTLGREI